MQVAPAEMAIQAATGWEGQTILWGPQRKTTPRLRRNGILLPGFSYRFRQGAGLECVNFKVHGPRYALPPYF